MGIDKKAGNMATDSKILKHNLHVYSFESYFPLSWFFLQGIVLRTEQTVQFYGHSSARAAKIRKITIYGFFISYPVMEL